MYYPRADAGEGNDGWIVENVILVSGHFHFTPDHKLVDISTSLMDQLSIISLHGCRKYVDQLMYS